VLPETLRPSVNTETAVVPEKFDWVSGLKFHPGFGVEHHVGLICFDHIGVVEVRQVEILGVQFEDVEGWHLDVAL